MMNPIGISDLLIEVMLALLGDDEQATVEQITKMEEAISRCLERSGNTPFPQAVEEWDRRFTRECFTTALASLDLWKADISNENN